MTDSSNTQGNLKFFFVMTLISVLVIGISYTDVKLGTITHDTQSLTEFSEIILLVFIAYNFYTLISHRKDLKRALVLTSAFFMVMFIRELDALFDMIVHGFWKVPALSITFAAIFYFAKEFKSGIEQLKIIMASPSFKMLIFGMVFLLIYSRLFGMGELWRTLMQENYVYAVKATIEETTELFAYFIIGYSSVRMKSELKG